MGRGSGQRLGSDGGQEPIAFYIKPLTGQRWLVGGTERGACLMNASRPMTVKGARRLLSVELGGRIAPDGPG